MALPQGARTKGGAAEESRYSQIIGPGGQVALWVREPTFLQHRWRSEVGGVLELGGKAEAHFLRLTLDRLLSLQKIDLLSC